MIWQARSLVANILLPIESLAESALYVDLILSSDDILRIYDEDANADLLTNICGRFSNKQGFEIQLESFKLTAWLAKIKAAFWLVDSAISIWKPI